MGFFGVCAFVVAVAALCVYRLQHCDLEFDSLTVDSLSLSKHDVSPLLLGSLRASFSLVTWAVAGYLIVEPHGLDLSLLMRDGSVKPVHLQSIERFVMFTVWSWLIEGVYFGLAACYSLAHHFSFPLPANESVKSATWILFEVSFPISFMVSAVVTFVLIPVALKQKISVKHFFFPAALLMHNANVVFMSVELMLNRLPFAFAHFPFILLYGIMYIVFSWMIFQTKGVFYYFFLDYGRKGAVFWYMGLVAGISVFFAFGWGMAQVIAQHPHEYWPYLILTCATLGVLKLRP